jgi:hypothetical protein
MRDMLAIIFHLCQLSRLHSRGDIAHALAKRALADPCHALTCATRYTVTDASADPLDTTLCSARATVTVAEPLDTPDYCQSEGMFFCPATCRCVSACSASTCAEFSGGPVAPACASSSVVASSCPICYDDDDVITSLTVEWTGASDPALTFEGATSAALGNAVFVLTDDNTSASTGKRMAKGMRGTAALWENRVDVGFSGGDALSLATSCSPRGSTLPALGEVLDFGSENTLKVVGFSTAAGRDQGDCNTCYASDQSCRDVTDEFYCPNPAVGVGPAGSNGPLGATAERFPRCVSSCTSCTGLTVNGTGEVHTAKVGGGGGKLHTSDPCTVVRPFGDEEHDHNTCSGPTDKAMKKSGNQSESIAPAKTAGLI